MRDGLREQIAAQLHEKHAPFATVRQCEEIADDLLAGPLQGLAEQAAEAARLRAVVARAEEIAHRLPYLGVGEAWNRALDGEGTDG